MKAFLLPVLVFSAALTVAACGNGGANNSAPANTSDSHMHDHDDGHGHEHGHDEGEQHDLGDRDNGEWHMEAIQVGEVEDGKESSFAINLKKGGEDAKDAQVTTWIGDNDGKDLAPHSSGEWDGKEMGYHCHVSMPSKLPADAKLWVRVMHGGKEVFKEHFDLHRE